MFRDPSVDGLLIARRLARFSPTSLSLEDVGASWGNRKNPSRKAESEFIPPSPSVVTEASPGFRVPKPVTGHRFGFLLEDIKPIDKPKQAPRMRYELPNVKQLPSSLKFGRPLLVVSLSSTDLQTVTHAISDESVVATQVEQMGAKL
jgi:hypothetical protein